MKNYTDKVLTVIAFCLVVQTFSQMPWIEKAYASEENFTNVVICNQPDAGWRRMSLYGCPKRR